MTNEELDAIRKRAAYVIVNTEWQSNMVSDLIEDDVPALLSLVAQQLAEVERLRKALEEIADFNEYLSGDAAREALRND